MSGFDIDHVARLWQQDPDPQEQAAFRSLADKAARRGRLADLADYVLGAVLVIALLANLLWEPAPRALLVGAIVIGAIAWSAWKRGNLSQAGRLLETNNRADFVTSAVTAHSARLGRSTLGLVLFLPSIFLGSLLVYAHGQGRSLTSFYQEMLARALSSPRHIVTLTAAAAVLVFLVHTNVRLRRELRRLQALADQYRAEERLETEGEQTLPNRP